MACSECVSCRITAVFQLCKLGVSRDITFVTTGLAGQKGIGGREGIRTPGLLVANDVNSKLRRGAAIT